MAANVRHSSESNEFYTPIPYVEIFRYVLGGIDLDPASSLFANEAVKASTIYTIENNGLWQPEWRGRVLLNAPGGLVDDRGQPVIRAKTVKGVKVPGCTETGACGIPAPHAHSGVTSSAVTWWRALCGEWVSNHVPAAIFVGFSLELLQSAQAGENPGHQPLDFYACIPKERIKFDIVRDGKRIPGDQPTHSNVLVLLPAATEKHVDVNMLARFDEALGPMGYVHRGNGQYS